MDPVFLHLASRDLGDAEVAEERVEMEANSDTVTLNPADATLSLGDNLVFLQELLRRLPEGLLRFQQAGAVLAAQFQIPVLGDLLGEGDVFFLGGRAVLLAPQRRRALPEAAVAAPVELNFAVHQLVACHGARHNFCD